MTSGSFTPIRWTHRLVRARQRVLLQRLQLGTLKKGRRRRSEAATKPNATKPHRVVEALKTFTPLWTDCQIRCWQNLFPSSPIHTKSAFIMGELLMLLMASCCWTLIPLELPWMVKFIASLPLFNKHVTGCYMIPSLDFFFARYLCRSLFSTGFTLLCWIILFIIFSFRVFIVFGVQRGKQGIHVKHFKLHLKRVTGQSLWATVTLFISDLPTW